MSLVVFFVVVVVERIVVKRDEIALLVSSLFPLFLYFLSRVKTIMKRVTYATRSRKEKKGVMNVLLRVRYPRAFTCAAFKPTARLPLLRMR
jgi:hypothetical protein